MRRRSFIKQNSLALAGIPFLRVNGLLRVNGQDNPDFPFTTDFPEAQKRFKLYRERLYFRSVITSRSVENAAALLEAKGQCSFHGSRLPSMLVLDLGKEVVGDYSFVASAKDPCEVTITYGEGLDEVLKGFAGINWYQHPKDVFTVAGPEQRYTLKGRRAFRYLRIDTSGEMAIQLLEIFLEHYPVAEKGRFFCSDVVLNHMWQVGQYTTKLCMQQFYEDGVKRDGLLWVSDYRIQFLCNAYAFGDAALARKSLFMIAASQRKDGAIPACAAYGGGHQHPHNINYMGRIPFSYGAHWILINYSADFLSCLQDYVTYTGDRSIIEPLLPTVERLLQFLESVDYYANPNMPMGRDRLTDDAALPRDMKGILEGSFLLQVYMNFRDGEKLLQTHHKSLATKCRLLAQRIEELVDANHYDAANKLYKDFAGDIPQYSWHTSSFAVLSGKQPAADRLEMLKRTDAVTQIDPAVGAMKMFQVMALFEAGWTERAVHEMKRYWGLQLREGATTFWEYLKLNPPLQQWWESALMSRCHGWSAGPTFLLPRYLLGVGATDSWAAVTINPCMDVLDWAEGSVPTPYGDIEVMWEKGKKALVRLPAGVSATWVHNGETRVLEGNKEHEIALQ